MTRHLSDFAGTWRIDRRIDDRRAGQQAGFVGEAVFKGDDRTLNYTETGMLTLPDQPGFSASRRYLWTAAGSGEISVSFDDRRFFHTFDAGNDSPATTHDCPPDTYAVRYDFSRWPRWCAVWSVTGPRKDYTMTSDYSPIPDQA